jgi:poly-gamma-glutamate capsule biosynthesis protein CapA/YwtB (metallophosphatase superfamily)
MMNGRAGAIALLLGAVLAVSGCAVSSAVPSSSTDAPVVAALLAAPTPSGSIPGDASEPESTPTATPTATATPAPTPQPVLVPLVPVTESWSTERTITRRALAATLAGRGAHPRQVFVSAADLAPLAAALGVVAGPNVRAVSLAKVRAALAKVPSALGILRAEDVTPEVQALAIDGVPLFGETRVRDLAGWPLVVAEPAGAALSTFEPASLWTLAAGGDVMLDREVYRIAVTEGRGADYPWAGGTAAITGHTCCGAPGQALVTGRRTGNAGAVRALLRGADVALVNLEGPAPDDHAYHPDGYVFTMDPKLLAGLDRAGIDVVSLANNHIVNAGAIGVTQTIRRLDNLGIAHAGAGRSAAAARRPAWLEAAGLRIAVLAYNGVAPRRNATRTTAGAAPLEIAPIRDDIRAARRAGADVVIVVPHWGREYTDAVTAEQRRLAAALVDAGADVILGSHSHWAGPLELVDGRLVVHSLGDLVFDLQHDARTQQGLIAELTFVGARLAQVDLHPTLILDASQPSLLDPKGGGDALLRSIRAGSARLGRLP